MTRTHILMLPALLSVACGDAPPSETLCSGSSGPTVLMGSATQYLTGSGTTRDLQVSGTATHTEHLTIRRVLVAGVAAQSVTPNFATWSATIPAATLAALATNSMVTITAEALDACNRSAPIATLGPIPWNTQPKVELKVAIPGGRTFLPASGAVPAELTVTANPEAAGATAVVSVSAPGVNTQTLNVPLSSNGTNPASGVTLLRLTAAASYLVSVALDGRQDATLVNAAGAPSLLPGSLVLVPGGSGSISATSDGDVDECTVVASGQATATKTRIDPRRIDIAIDATKAADGDRVEIACRDSYGQASAVGVAKVVKP